MSYWVWLSKVNEQKDISPRIFERITENRNGEQRMLVLLNLHILTKPAMSIL